MFLLNLRKFKIFQICIFYLDTFAEFFFSSYVNEEASCKQLPVILNSNAYIFITLLV